MNPNNEIENIQDLSDGFTIDESATVEDFIKELEAKEKDLHITAETTFIEIAQNFDDGELPGYLPGEFSPAGQISVSPVIFPLPDSNGNNAYSLEDEIKELRNQIAHMATERSELNAKSDRRAKDFEAFKARTERERVETFRNQLSNLAVKMLPALDNLDRALKFASEMPESKRNKFTQFFDGIVLVNQQVNEVLADMGILPIDTVGNIFDPNFHEAVALEESGDFPPNTISEELMRGYRIGEKVIRHSMVKVSKSLPVIESSTAAAGGEHGDIDFSYENSSGGAADSETIGETPENE